MKNVNRKQLRLPDYDYSTKGFYYVTVCTYNRNRLLGKIENGKMILSRYGKIADYTWQDLKNHNSIELHEYVIMPDHIHGIIQLHEGQKDISEIVRQFKTFTSKRINEFLKQNGLQPFSAGEIWQRSFYDHVIRDENDYLEKVQYIINNPLKEELYKNDGYMEN